MYLSMFLNYTNLYFIPSPGSGAVEGGEVVHDVDQHDFVQLDVESLAQTPHLVGLLLGEELVHVGSHQLHQHRHQLLRVGDQLAGF